MADTTMLAAVLRARGGVHRYEMFQRQSLPSTE
jgi:hypothetical protein